MAEAIAAQIPEGGYRIAVIGNQGRSLVHFRGSLMRALVERGCEVFALAPNLAAEEEAALRDCGVHPVAIPMRRSSLTPLRDFRDFCELTWTLRNLRVDVAFSNFAKPVIYGSLAAKRAGVPRRFSLIAGLGYAFVRDGRMSPKRFLLRRLLMALYRIALRGNARVFFQNREDRDYFLRKRVVGPEQAVLVNGTGVDLEAFLPAPAVTRPVTFVVAARLIREKGIEDFAGAARHLIARYGDGVRFVLLGGLDNNPSALPRERIEGWVAEGLLEWPGQVSEIGDWLRQASVMVLPSFYREGVPRSLQEAMAMARPIITTDLPGCRETVHEGVNGFLVPPRDPHALADAMERFVKEPRLIETLGKESRRLAEAKFDVRQINHQLIAQLLGDSGQPRP
jgi:glycosyltransferase involved in cell wall biosynthesis